MYDVLIKNGKLVSPDRIYEADICITDGKYSAFAAPGTIADSDAKKVIDAKGNYVFPGIIDCHAHMNEPGFEYREDFETGSRAAVSAGCTTLIDMPLNNDPSLMNKVTFDSKLEKISRHSYVDFALWGGLVGDYDDKPDSVHNNINEKDLVDQYKGEFCGDRLCEELKARIADIKRRYPDPPKKKEKPAGKGKGPKGRGRGHRGGPKRN